MKKKLKEASNTSMRIIILVMILLSISCQKEVKKELANKNTDYLSKKKDTTFTQYLWKIHQNDGVMEELQLYISNKNDTILNQSKYFKNEILDTVKSKYYTLSTAKTKTPHVYQGTITVNSFINKFKLSKNEKYDIEFSYWQISRDSTYLTTFKANQKNKIRFKYTNIVDDNLSGIVLVSAENDTLQNGKKMVRLRNEEILVDNKVETNNVFLNAFEFYKDYKFAYKKFFP